MKINKIMGFLAFSLVLLPAQAALAENHAIIIGIDEYQPKNPPQAQELTKPSVKQETRKSFGNLDGAVNDANSIEELLRTRYGFKQIRLLLNQQASRANILKALRQELISQVKPGDNVVFYYAGHGSQQLNSLTKEEDQLDETIVPADSYLGVDDIRDKELKESFNQLLDKGVQLTAIFDSCHSGSISRGNGLASLEKSRQLSPLMMDIHDGSKENLVAPEKRGAVILSAAQSSEFAHETQAEVERNGKKETEPHGAFTWALVQKLQSTPRLPLSQVVLQVQTMMTQQKPVLAGPAQRLAAPFLGTATTGQTETMVAIKQLQPNSQQILLKAGSAMGLNPGTVLKKAGSQARLVVTEVKGLSESMAELESGKLEELTVGDLLSVERWGQISEYQTLWMWLPEPASSAELQALSETLASVKKQGISLIEDPTFETPSHSLFKTKSGWILVGAHSDGSPITLGSQLKTQDLQKALQASAPVKDVKLFVARPLPQELYAQLAKKFEDPLNAAQRVEDIRKANYYLVGNSQGYAWMRPGAAFNVRDLKKLAMSSLPPRSDWVQLDGAVSQTGPKYKPCPDFETVTALPSPAMKADARLFDFGLRLAKINSLLTLNSPTASAAGNGPVFPYQLALREVSTSQVLDPQQTPLQACHDYELILTADPEVISSQPIERRFVYILGLDSFGNVNLLFPDPAYGNSGNQLPSKPTSGTSYASQIPLGELGSFRVVPPYGVDTYLLLSTDEPIPEDQFGSLQQQGVRTRSAKGPTNGLESLFSQINASTRAGGRVPKAKMNWGIEKMPTLSLAP